ncbi:hypothetical protein LCGC14_2869060 [marine sediment metagenome]|uniref:Uncharacterized protein n=1 Tax=marine sediment metagenome TaxID=412755 RepID=A0A0F8Y3E3_9ZZZZ
MQRKTLLIAALIDAIQRGICTVKLTEIEDISPKLYSACVLLKERELNLT